MDDIEWVTALFTRYPTETSERTFGALFIWRKYGGRSRLSSIDGHLLISWGREKFGNTLLAPVGPNPAMAIQMLASPQLRPTLSFNGIFGIVGTLIHELGTYGLSPVPLREEWDYVYLREDLVRLEGPRYHTKRKEMKKATSSLSTQYVPFTDQLIGQCLELEETWCDMKHCTFDRLSEAEDAALKEALLNHERLGFIGGVVTIDGKVQALSVGERLNDNTAVVHFEKANPAIRGLYQVINQQFCEHALDGFMYVNREQDVGEPGLRRAKEGYHPHHFVEKHYLPLR